MKTPAKTQNNTGEKTEPKCAREWLELLAVMEGLPTDSPAVVHPSPAITVSELKLTAPIAFKKVNSRELETRLVEILDNHNSPSNRHPTELVIDTQQN